MTSAGPKDLCLILQKVGPTAVVRNITHVLRGQRAQRLIVTDNYYTSVALSLKLLQMGLYHVGTVRTNRLGWCKEITYGQKTRPKSIARGTYRLAQAKEHPELIAISWMDSRPVNFFTTGCSTAATDVSRREKNGSVTKVPCPQLVRDYHTGMGGVDVHDQLRLQRYSVQKCVRYKKYYKTLFLGLVDMALINGFITHKLAMMAKGEKPPLHAEYMRRLQVELLSLQHRDFTTNMQAEDLLSAPAQPTSHTLVNTTAMYTSETQNKRRQYLCKVCSALSHAKTKSFETSFECVQCSNVHGGRVALCNKIRRHESGNTLTCGQIWHQKWSNGTSIPANLRSKIRFRGKAKRKRNAVDDDHEDSTTAKK